MNSQAESSTSKTGRGLILACLGIAAGSILILCLIAVGGVVWVANLPDCSVMLGYEIPEDTLKTLHAREPIRPDETILAYYDDSISCDGSDSSIVTNTRLIRRVNSSIVVLPLIEITDVEYFDGGGGGETIIVSASGGRTVRVEIAPWNGGAAFHSTLHNAWRQATE
jgi:hypothetical protein